MTRISSVMTRNGDGMTRNGKVMTRNGGVVTRNGGVVTRNGDVVARIGGIAIIVLAAVAAAGCSGGQSDLQKWIAETKNKAGGRVPPLPEVKPYETYVYSAGKFRSPFQPQGAGGANGQASARLSSRRNREFLEGFSLDTLKMVGTFKVGSSFYGLVQSKDGLVHKVQPGNYLGQNDGKVTEISSGKISLIEIIPDGLGGYIERPASLALSD